MLNLAMCRIVEMKSDVCLESVDEKPKSCVTFAGVYIQQATALYGKRRPQFPPEREDPPALSPRLFEVGASRRRN